MKRIMTMLCVLAVAAGCAKIETPETAGKQTITVTSDESLTKLHISDDPSASVFTHLWDANDSIALFDGTTNRKYVLSEGTGSNQGKFTGDALTSPAPYYAVYPYDGNATISEGVITTTFPAEQAYTSNSYDPSAIKMVAKTSDASEVFAFQLASSLMQITLTPTAAYTVKKVEVIANDGTIIAGTGAINCTGATPTVAMASEGGSPAITVTFGAEGKALTAGTPYTFYVALPAVTLTNGLSIAVTGADNKMFFAKTSAATAFERRKVTAMPALTKAPTILNLSLANSASVGLSTPETANCYVVNEAGTYAIPVDVRGNEETPTLFGLTSVEEVWDENDKVGSEKLYGKYITFKTEGDGNALVAVKKGDDIVWSWHIWETSYVLGEDDVTFTNGKMMPVTIGAYKTVEFEGNTYFYRNKIVFQYGRKDPFLAIKGKYTTRSTQATISETIKAPNVFIYKNHKWCTDYNLNWNTTKTIYDPSPVGYLIPSNTLNTEIKGKAKEDVGSIGIKLGGVFLPNGEKIIQSEGGSVMDSNVLWVWCGISTDGGSTARTFVTTDYGCGHGFRAFCMRAPK